MLRLELSQVPRLLAIEDNILPERVDSLIRDTSEDIVLGDDGRVLVAEDARAEE